MKSITRWTVLMLVVGLVMSLTGVTAQASEWRQKAELQTGGGAKEVQVGVNIKSVMIRCIEGSVIINTVVVREGEQKTPHKVGRRLEKGQDHVIELGQSRMVTGLRISDDARGTYRVFVKN